MGRGMLGLSFEVMGLVLGGGGLVDGWVGCIIIEKKIVTIILLWFFDF